MRKLKWVTVVGARPQFIKVAPLCRAIQAHNIAQPRKHIDHKLIHTGQHYDVNMSDLFFQQLGLPAPDYHLNVGGGLHGEMTGRMLQSLEAILLQDRPDWVLVYGDTNSTLAGALAAAKLGIPLAHVEAGLRSFNRSMPEEINRVVADHCSNLLLTTHAGASEQLYREGIVREKVCEVGDVMFDVALRYSASEEAEAVLKAHNVKAREYVLVTVHRAGNTDDIDRLRAIVEGLVLIAREVPVLFPAHPRTRRALEKLGDYPTHPQLQIVDPVGYFDMLALESRARLIITDSGGVQKEAYFCRVPCLILRDETEWVELVHHGYSRLVSANSAAMYRSYREILSQNMAWSSGLYGQGDAAQRIVDAILARS